MRRNRACAAAQCCALGAPSRAHPRASTAQPPPRGACVGVRTPTTLCCVSRASSRQNTGRRRALVQHVLVPRQRVAAHRKEGWRRSSRPSRLVASLSQSQALHSNRGNSALGAPPCRGARTWQARRSNRSRLERLLGHMAPGDAVTRNESTAERVSEPHRSWCRGIDIKGPCECDAGAQCRTLYGEKNERNCMQSCLASFVWSSSVYLCAQQNTQPGLAGGRGMRKLQGCKILTWPGRPLRAQNRVSGGDVAP